MQITIDHQDKITHFDIDVSNSYALRVGTLVLWCLFMGSAWYFLVWLGLDWPQVAKISILLFLIFFVYKMATSGWLSESWPFLLANNQYVYLLHKPLEKLFLKVPWKMVKDVEKDIVGVSKKKGIAIIIDGELVDEKQKNIVRETLCSSTLDDVRIVVPSGFVKREPVIEKLKILMNQAQRNNRR